MATTFTLAPPAFSRLEGLQSIPIEHIPAGATAFKVGEFLKNSAGTGIPITTGANTALLGLALVARVATADDIPYVKAMPGVLFEMSFEDSVAPGYALTAADLEAQYGLVVGSNIAYVDHNDTATKLVTIKGFVGAVGDIRARVIVEFIPAAYAAN